ncbi:hypothetical protein [Isobaculum melis]|uniref:hypothetical protein n=1 Tax=Isobaculum melis TaxID=142588 RepID=UPI000B831F6A|nr:hypothetical protein [Isobaculum melis]
MENALNELGKSKQFDASTGTYLFHDYSTSPWYNKLKEYNDSSTSQCFELVAADNKFLCRVCIDFLG